jgi:S-DNA-T family DNA segregation ATPase FtsK/SpoIIIE
LKSTKRKAPDAAKAKAERLSPEKSHELVGIVFLVVGAVLLVAVLSYHPLDPSLFNPLDADEARPRNLIGPFGAQVAAVFFEFIGVTAILAPIFLLLAGWRRVRHFERLRVIGRGLGVVVLMACLPPLLQLALGEVDWRGEEIWAGGGFGRLFSDALASQLGNAGAVVIFLGGAVLGFALLIQSTLGEVLARWVGATKNLWQRIVLVWSRNRERGAKDRARRRVMEKQLKRAAREESKRDAASATAQPSLDLPLRVSEKRGEGRFSIRKVGARAPEPAPGPAPEAPGPSRQKEIPFPKGGEGKPILPPADLLLCEEPQASFEENELVRLSEVIRARCAEFARGR